MVGLSTVSPVDTILNKETFTLEELLDEDEVIQECEALNSRLINFLQERSQIEQLLRYVVEEAPKDAEKRRKFKFPYVACKIFTCEVDIILKALVVDEQLLNLLFSFLEPDNSNSTLLADYFSKVVICLLRKTVLFMDYIQSHPNIVRELVDRIGITSISKVLICLIGADEHMYGSYTDRMRLIEDEGVLEIIVDKFSSSDCPEVHANAAEILCVLTRRAPPTLADKISNSRFVRRLFRHALEESQPKSVLVNSLTVCISLLDPEWRPVGTLQSCSCMRPTITANPKTVECMLGGIGDLLKRLEYSSEENILLTQNVKLQSRHVMHHVQIYEFFSVLVKVGGDAAVQEFIRLGVVKRALDFFLEHPFDHFPYYHVAPILLSCLESKNPSFVQHLLHDCNLVQKLIEAEKEFTLYDDANMPSVFLDGKTSSRLGNSEHRTHISHKIVHVGHDNSEVQEYLQENTEWVEYQTKILAKRIDSKSTHRCLVTDYDRFAFEGNRSVISDHAMKRFIASSDITMLSSTRSKLRTELRTKLLSDDVSSDSEGPLTILNGELQLSSDSKGPLTILNGELQLSSDSKGPLTILNGEVVKYTTHLPVPSLYFFYAKYGKATKIKIFTISGDACEKVFTLSNTNTCQHDLMILELRGKKCLTGYREWLVLLDITSYEYYLFNVNSMKKVKLFKSKSSHFSVCAMSGSPDDPQRRVVFDGMLKYSSGEYRWVIVICRPINNAYKKHKYRKFYPIHTATVFNGTFYGLVLPSFDLVCADVTSTLPEDILFNEAIQGDLPQLSMYEINEAFLVEGEGELMLPSVFLDGKTSSRLGNSEHRTHISHKIVHVGHDNSEVQEYLQENTEWVEYQTKILAKRIDSKSTHRCLVTDYDRFAFEGNRSVISDHAMKRFIASSDITMLSSTRSKLRTELRTELLSDDVSSDSEGPLTILNGELQLSSDSKGPLTILNGEVVKYTTHLPVPSLYFFYAKYGKATKIKIFTISGDACEKVFTLSTRIHVNMT